MPFGWYEIFGWEDDEGGGFCKPRLKLNPFDLAKVWADLFC